MSRPVLVVGAGGHAKVVLSTLRAAGLLVAGLFDGNPAKVGTYVLGTIVQDQQVLPSTGLAVLAIGGNDTRRRLAEGLPGLEWATIVHPAASVASGVTIGEGSVLFAGAAIQPGAVIGRHAIINTGASVDIDCRVADFVHLAPGTRLGSDVHVGEGSFLGIGAKAIPGTRIGAWTTVGAGGVVVRNLADGARARGVPARPS